MIGPGALAALPRSGVLHLVQATPPVGWSALAALPVDGARCIVVGRPGRGAAQLLRGRPVRVIVPPLGRPRLAAGRVRDAVRQWGTLPREVHCHGAAMAAVARAALGFVACSVHAAPPAGFALSCSEAAAALLVPGERAAVRAQAREALEIPPGRALVLAIGDRPDAIDAAEAFAAVGRAALAGADIALAVPEDSCGLTETLRHARRLGMAQRMIVVEGCGMPGPSWYAADVALLQRPTGFAALDWWGHSGWWALAAGLELVHASCFPGAGASGCYGAGDRLALVRWLLSWHDARCAAHR